MTDYTVLIVVTIIYLIAIAWLGFYAWTRTKTTADYLVAGRKAHPIIMALSYGATYISTSAIVGFGGAAADHLSTCFGGIGGQANSNTK